MRKNLYAGSAIVSGSLLGLMLFINGQLANYTSAFWSSMIAHFIGLFASWIAWKLFSPSKKLLPINSKSPRWAYFGGVVGALIVIFSNITVNSEFGLVGSLSLMILGQTFFAMLFDYKGWIGMQKRELTRYDFLQISCVLAGSLLIINA
jgi:bacterial/archaeal transporter family-2 protein